METETKCVVCGAECVELPNDGRSPTCSDSCWKARVNRRTRAEQLAIEMDEYKPGAYSEKDFGHQILLQQ